MDYIKLRKIAKFQVGGKAKAIADFKANHASELTGYETDDMGWNMLMAQPIDDSEPEERLPDLQKQQKFLQKERIAQGMSNKDLKAAKADLTSRGMISPIPETSDSPIEEEVTEETSSFGQKAGAATAAIAGSLGKFAVGLGKQELSALGGQMGEMGVSSMEQGMQALMQGNKDGLANLYAGAVTSAMGVTENELMGDKNFGARSAAIDQTVHGASKALMSSGNPYSALAGVALEGANFLTKAGGQTVQGFDVDINNSGYGNIGHMESSSSRDFGTLIGLGGLTDSKMAQKLAKRNEQARMALKAASISEDQSFEQEARRNSVTNTIMQNQQALSGGIDLSNI